MSRRASSISTTWTTPTTAKWSATWSATRARHRRGALQLGARQTRYGQTTKNQFAPSTPDNRENVNYLSTGPDFTLSLGSRNKLLLNGRFADVSYEDSELGNQRVRGALALRRDLSDATNVSINVTTEQVSFDDDSAVRRLRPQRGIPELLAGCGAHHAVAGRGRHRDHRRLAKATAAGSADSI